MHGRKSTLSLLPPPVQDKFILAAVHTKDYKRCSELIMALSHTDLAPNSELVSFTDGMVQRPQHEDEPCHGNHKFG